MSPLVDTHAHIDLPDFDEDRGVVMQQARDAGVAAIVAIGFNPERWRTTGSLSRTYPCVVRAVGVHPNNAGGWSDDVRSALLDQLAHRDVVALGEIGLDYFRDHASRDDQRACFIAQLALARDASLPIIIHQRSAEDELLEILRPFAPLRGVLHCFSSDSAFANACLELGLHLGIGGVFTYPKSTDVRRAVNDAPLDRILLETDAPYLAPDGYRGKRNEPAHVRIVAERLAAERRVPLSVVSEATTKNAVELFGDQLANALDRTVGAVE